MVAEGLAKTGSQVAVATGSEKKPGLLLLCHYTNHIICCLSKGMGI